MDFSPFNGHNLPNTVKRNSANNSSFRKYPTDKYLINEDSDPSDVKYQLFVDQCKENLDSNLNSARIHQKTISLHRISQKDRLRLNKDHKNALKNISYSQDLKNTSKCQKKPVTLYNTLSQRNNSSQLLCRSMLQEEKKVKKSRAQSHFQTSDNQKKVKQKSKKQNNKKQTQKNYVLQIEEELQMYKNLCKTLRKQNHELEGSINVQKKKNNQFQKEISELKAKIKKLYDYCIEKNKRSASTDVKLKMFISSKNDQINSSYLRQNKHSKALQEAKFGLNNKCKKQSELKKASESKPNHRTPVGIDSQRLQSTIQYSEQSEGSNRGLSKTHLGFEEYKEFFDIFERSVSIFQKASTNRQQTKTEILKASNHLRWAKQTWLQIVEFLICRNYQANIKEKAQKNKNNLIR